MTTNEQVLTLEQRIRRDVIEAERVREEKGQWRSKANEIAPYILCKDVDDQPEEEDRDFWWAREGY